MSPATMLAPAPALAFVLMLKEVAPAATVPRPGKYVLRTPLWAAGVGMTGQPWARRLEGCNARRARRKLPTRKGHARLDRPSLLVIAFLPPSTGKHLEGESIVPALPSQVKEPTPAL